MRMTGADCHCHVFNPSRFAYRADASYTPHPAQEGTPDQYLAVLDAHGLSHGLVVGPEPYGTDNTCVLDALANSGGRLKGIALVKPDVTESEIARLAAGGFVGVRFNVLNHGVQVLQAGQQRLLPLLKQAGWYAQVQVGRDLMVDALPYLQKAGARVIVDHCGRPAGAAGVQQPGFQAVLELGRSTDAIVKLSGAFRISAQPYPYSDVEPFVRALVEAYTLDRCVWGSDWPFVRFDGRVDYGPQFALLARWFTVEERQRILCDNPQRLFGFR